jgi:hypothetical protein
VGILLDVVTLNYDCLRVCLHPTALGPGVHSASNINEYQKQKSMFLWSRARPVRRADEQPSVSRLSRPALSNAAPAIYFSSALRKHII